jgi:hypothetical protein
MFHRARKYQSSQRREANLRGTCTHFATHAQFTPQRRRARVARERFCGKLAKRLRAKEKYDATNGEWPFRCFATLR